MKKITFSIVIFFSILLNSFSQDIIYKTDGTKEEAKVLMVGESQIQYKKWSNQDGPVYEIPRSNILLITYQNGEYEIMNQPQVAVEQPEEQATMAKKELSENFTKNILTYNAFDVFYGDIAFSYERVLNSGYVGLLIPVGFGYAYNFDYFNNNDNWVKNLFYSGFGAYFYPGGQGRWRYFVGPKMLFGYGKQTYWVDYWDEFNNYYYSEETYDEGFYMKYMVDNGLRVTPIKNFSIAAVLSIGVRFFPEAADYSNNAVMPTGHFGLNLSYRF